MLNNSAHVSLFKRFLDCPSTHRLLDLILSTVPVHAQGSLVSETVFDATHHPLYMLFHAIPDPTLIYTWWQSYTTKKICSTGRTNLVQPEEHEKRKCALLDLLRIFGNWFAEEMKYTPLCGTKSMLYWIFYLEGSWLIQFEYNSKLTWARWKWLVPYQILSWNSVL